MTGLIAVRGSCASVTALGVLALIACGGGDSEGGASMDASDPLFTEQWHLANVGQKGGKPGEDIRVRPVWNTYLGDGVRIAVVDDGLEIAHEDLVANVVPGASHNYLNGTSNPTPPLSPSVSADLSHGTSVAGLAGATGYNGIGVRGVAPAVGLVGYNMLRMTTSSNEADAMVRGSPNIGVSINSWGVPDRNGLIFQPGINWRQAVIRGVTRGRRGLGTVYVWAAGNGHPIDDSNYDGYANFSRVMAIGAVNDKGLKASYSEQGANVLVSAPGGEVCDTHTLTTVDLSGPAGENNNGRNRFSRAPDYLEDGYTKCFNGTSGATPIVAGVVALMLQANPNLTWRDARLILAESARKNHPADPDWTVNGGGLHINHKYGFGVVNAQAAVLKAQAWTNIGPQLIRRVSSRPNMPIPDGSTSPATGISRFGAPVRDAITIASAGRLRSIEFVDVILTSNHPHFGDLEVTLRSPAGTVSRLSRRHVCQFPCDNAFATGARFGSVRHLNETQVTGDWTLTVRDGLGRDIGNFRSWTLVLYGH